MPPSRPCGKRVMEKVTVDPPTKIPPKTFNGKDNPLEIDFEDKFCTIGVLLSVNGIELDPTLADQTDVKSTFA